MLSPTFERGQGTKASVRDLWQLQSLPSFGADGTRECYFVHRVTGSQQWEAPPGFFIDEVERQISNESIDELLTSCSSPAEILTHIGLVPLTSAFLNLLEAFESGEDTAKTVDVTPLHLVFLRLRRSRIRSLHHFGESAWVEACSAFGFALPSTIASFLTCYLPAATAMEGAILLSEMSISDERIAKGLINGDISSIHGMINECTRGLRRALFGRKEALEYRTANGEIILQNDNLFVDSFMLIAWLQFLTILLESHAATDIGEQSLSHNFLDDASLISLSSVLIEILQCSSSNPNASLCALRLLGLLHSSAQNEDQKRRYLSDTISMEGFGSMLVRSLDGLLDSSVSNSTAETVFHVLSSELPGKNEDLLTVLITNQDRLLLSLLRFASALIEYKTSDSYTSKSSSQVSSTSSATTTTTTTTHCVLYSTDAKVLVEIAIRECSNLPDGSYLIRSAWFDLIHSLLLSSVWYEGGLNKNVEMINKLNALSEAHSKSSSSHTEGLLLQKSATKVNSALKESERMLSEI
jgi:hypothetical protein